MANENYRAQVYLMLNVLPEVAKEKYFALHGGTAINLFVRNMPRLSVDIDLTYLPIEDRETSLDNISAGLSSIEKRILTILPKAKTSLVPDTSKLFIDNRGTQVKIEVNQTNRGALRESQTISLCEKAQEEFEQFCEVPVIGEGQLYGGKICAALDRQHPRDLFDVKYFLENNEFNDEHREGLLLAILSSNRPIEELLYPSFLNQKATLINQFDGMTNEHFNYMDFENTRETLLERIHQSLSSKDKEFLVSFQKIQPIWDIYDFERFPSIQWKLQNLEKLKETNSDKFNEQLDSLIKKLGS